MSMANRYATIVTMMIICALVISNSIPERFARQNGMTPIQSESCAGWVPARSGLSVTLRHRQPCENRFSHTSPFITAAVTEAAEPRNQQILLTRKNGEDHPQQENKKRRYRFSIPACGVKNERKFTATLYHCNRTTRRFYHKLYI